MAICVCFIKVIAAVILFVAFVIGIHAHYEGEFTKYYKGENVTKCENANDLKNKTEGLTKNLGSDPKIQDQIKIKETDIPTCPTGAVPLELTFIAFTGILFVASVVMIILGMVVGQRTIKICDSFYSALAGILILIAGILMIVSACWIDKYRSGGWFDKETPETKKIVAEMRERDLFWNKIVAGCLAIVDGILYKVAASIICACSD